MYTQFKTEMKNWNEPQLNTETLFKIPLRNNKMKQAAFRVGNYNSPSPAEVKT